MLEHLFCYNKQIYFLKKLYRPLRAVVTRFEANSCDIGGTSSSVVGWLEC